MYMGQLLPAAGTYVLITGALPECVQREPQHASEGLPATGRVNKRAAGDDGPRRWLGPAFFCNLTGQMEMERGRGGA